MKSAQLGQLVTTPRAWWELWQSPSASCLTMRTGSCWWSALCYKSKDVIQEIHHALLQQVDVLTASPVPSTLEMLSVCSLLEDQPLHPGGVSECGRCMEQ